MPEARTRYVGGIDPATPIKTLFHYSNDSANAEWLQQMRKIETEGERSPAQAEPHEFVMDPSTPALLRRSSVMNNLKLTSLALSALDERPPRNLRRYPRMIEADDCEECHGNREVERNINGCDVMVECGHCCPPPRSHANSWQDRDADEAGVRMYGEL